MRREKSLKDENCKRKAIKHQHKIALVKRKTFFFQLSERKRNENCCFSHFSLKHFFALSFSSSWLKVQLQSVLKLNTAESREKININLSFLAFEGAKKHEENIKIHLFTMLNFRFIGWREKKIIEMSRRNFIPSTSLPNVFISRILQQIEFEIEWEFNSSDESY